MFQIFNWKPWKCSEAVGTAGQIERELGITPGLLGKWRARYQIIEDGTQAAKIVPSDMDGAKARIRRPQRELSAVEEEREILKKFSTFSPKRMKYAFIGSHECYFSVKRMCKVLKVTRSGYYAWCRHTPSKREQSNQKLLEWIKKGL